MDTSRILQDFYEYVIETEHGMEWAAATTDKGYGNVGGNRGGNISSYAHRVAYILEFGPLSDDLDLDHDPGCPKTCVTPEHLTPRTKSEHSIIGWERGELDGGWGTKRVRIHPPKPEPFSWQLEMACPRCTTMFLPNTAKQKYCSEICMRQAKEERRNRYPRPDFADCARCGVEFSPKRVDTRFCSRKCIDDNSNERRR